MRTFKEHLKILKKMVNPIDPRIILALDFASEFETLSFLEGFEPKFCRLKIGKQLFVREGPKIVTKLVNQGYDIFLDLKFHDIPNTVANACMAAADLGCWMINVHALGGKKMMESAANSFARLKNPPLLVSVTVLTSLSDDDLKGVGLNMTIDEQAKMLAKQSYDAGLDGVVCSALEIKSIKKYVGDRFIFVTPGIRLEDDLKHDQSRVVTPKAAILLDSNYLVIGRSITKNKEPVKKLQQLVTDLQ